MREKKNLQKYYFNLTNVQLQLENGLSKAGGKDKNVIDEFKKKVIRCAHKGNYRQKKKACVNYSWINKENI